MITQIKLFATLLVAVMALAFTPTTFADDSAASADAQPIMLAAANTGHPPEFVRGVHDMAFLPDPEFTYGEYVEYLVVEELQIESAVFFAKNPLWKKLEHRLMTSEKVMLGVHL